MANVQELSFLREDATRTERWKHLTEDVADEYQKRVLETLLDNEATYLNKYPVFEESSTSDIAVFTRMAKPIIRRIYPALIANQLVSIQPMTQPTGKIFYIDHKYEDNRAPTVAGDRLDYEANKHNKFYASGVIRGEAVGTGNAALTAFTLALHPVKPASLTVKVNASIVSNYTFNDVTGVITFAAAPANGAAITADYSLIMEALGKSGNATIPRVKFGMSSDSLDTFTKKILAEWTVEVQQDLFAYHGLSAERELVPLLGDEVRRELDRQIIDELLSGATAGNVNWSQAIPTGSSAKEYYETLVHAMADASNLVYKKRLRQPNWAVMHPDTLAFLDKTNTFRVVGGQPDGASPRAQVTSGPNVFGTVSNRWTIIVDPLFSTSKILLGYKAGDGVFSETGYVFGPYTMFMSETFNDPNTLVPVKGFMSRQGTKMVNGDYYSTVTVTA